MPSSFFNRLQSPWRRTKRWFDRTPERALEQAYEAALKIRALEDEHFQGQPIAVTSNIHTGNVLNYFRADLQKYLRTINLQLGVFRTSRSVLNQSEQPLGPDNDERSQADRARQQERESIILDKLQFIDDVTGRYQASGMTAPPPQPPPPKPSQSTKKRSQPTQASQSQALVPVLQSKNPTNGTTIALGPAAKGASKAQSKAPKIPLRGGLDDPLAADEYEMKADRTSFLPRSILGTIDRVRRELDPKAEEEVVKSFRSSKTKTVVSLRFILLLILIPLLMQQVSKNFIVGPAVDYFRGQGEATAFLNFQQEREALEELQTYEDTLRFERLIHHEAPLTTPEMEEKLRERADEIAADYQQRSSGSIKNVFADLFAVGAFIVVFTNSKQEIATLKSFIDEIIYGLSDSAKAFIIILFTDIFVGFHSPHGWEVLLEGISRHLGLPESREFIFLFIATFPVILDTVFKYWIFRYLNRVSPSAVATYRNMNE